MKENEAGQKFITEDDYKGIKKAYNKAVKDNKEEFTYEGEVFLVRYAKYLLEFLESKMKK